MSFTTTLDSTFPSMKHSEESCKYGLREVKNGQLKCQGQPWFLVLQGEGKRHPAGRWGGSCPSWLNASFPNMGRKHPHLVFIP